MGTEIKILYKKPIYTKERADFEAPFYCKEAPFEVLKELFPIFHIQKYNSLETWGTVARIPKESKYSKSNEENNLLIHGLSITNFEPQNGMSISESLKDYKMDIPIPNTFIGLEKKLMENFIARYLIEKKVTDSGNVTQNYLHQTSIGKYGKQKAIQYVKERKNHIDEVKENYLKDILDFGKVALGEDFNLKKLRKMSRKVAREIPTRIMPTRTYFANLRPSR